MKMFLSGITKNLNWEILTRIELHLKGGMGLKMEDFNIMWVHWKILFFGGWTGVTNKQIYRGQLPKKVVLDSLQI